jgi:hypothetical protein
MIPSLANGIAIYGGSDNIIENNYIQDIIFAGGGINPSSAFSPIKFSMREEWRKGRREREGEVNNNCIDDIIFAGR